MIPRSVMFTEFDVQPHLLVGLGDGRMLNYEFNKLAEGDVSKCSLDNLKRIALEPSP